MKSHRTMKRAALAFPANRRTLTPAPIRSLATSSPVGVTTSRVSPRPCARTTSSISSECAHCRRRQHVARTIDVLLISVSTLSIVAFLLAAVVIHRVELVTHIAHGCRLHLNQAHVVAISLEAVAVTGLVISALLWVFVAIATPLPGFLGDMVQQRIPAELRDRFTKAA